MGWWFRSSFPDKKVGSEKRKICSPLFSAIYWHDSPCPGPSNPSTREAPPYRKPLVILAFRVAINLIRICSLSLNMVGYEKKRNCIKVGIIGVIKEWGSISDLPVSRHYFFITHWCRFKAFLLNLKFRKIFSLTSQKWFTITIGQFVVIFYPLSAPTLSSQSLLLPLIFSPATLFALTPPSS